MSTALRKWFNTIIIGYLTNYVAWNHQRSIICIQIVYYLASSLQLMTWILIHVLAFHPLERLRWSLAWISSLPKGLSPSYIFWWQLMWWVTTDVAVSVCGRSGLWPFRFVAVPVCGRSGLWPFRFEAVPVCGRSGLWPFRFVAVSAVAISVCGRYDLLPLKQRMQSYVTYSRSIGTSTSIGSCRRLTYGNARHISRIVTPLDTAASRCASIS